MGDTDITDILDRFPIKSKSKRAIFEKLLSVASIDNMTPEERAEYERSEAAYRENMNAYEYAKRQGEKEGMAEGIRLVAKNLKQNGIDIALIMHTTGLSETEINAL